LTVISTLTRKEFIGTGVATEFDLSPMRVFSAAELTVTVNGAALSSFTFVADGAGSGEVLITPAPANLATVVIEANPAFTQQIDFENEGPYLPETQNEGLDRSVARDLVLKAGVDRSVRVDSGSDPIAPLTPVPGQFLAWTSGGQIGSSSGTGADAGLRTDLATSGGSALVGFTRTGGTARSLQSKVRDRFDLRDFGVRNRFITSNEYTAEINAALAQAKAEGVTTVYCAESYRVMGTLVQPASVGIVSDGGVSRWFEGSPVNETAGPGFFKPSDGLNGALLVRGVGAHLIGISLDHQTVGGATEAMGGIMRMGPPGDETFNYTLTMNVHVRGHEINESTGLRRGTVNSNGQFGAGVGVDCHAIVFPRSTLGSQRYWHQLINPYIQNARVGFKLREQSNAMFISGYRFQAVYRPVWLKGDATECIENIFDGVWAQNYWLPTTTQTAIALNALSPAARLAALADAAMITCEDSCGLNQFRGPTENGSRLWYISPASAARFNDASGLINNEAFASPNPSAWALPINIENAKRTWGPKREKVLPLDGADDNDSQGWGARIDIDQVLTSNLPLLNGAVGAPTTGAASRIITRWTEPQTVGKAAAPHIDLKTKVTVHASGGGAGTHSVEVDWEYRVANNAGAAGELLVKRVTQFPAAANYIVGLHLITGETGASRPFAIALTLGNLAATAPTSVTVSHQGLLHSTNNTKRPVAEYSDIDMTPTALTANDVTDAVSLLTTGVTAI